MQPLRWDSGLHREEKVKLLGLVDKLELCTLALRGCRRRDGDDWVASACRRLEGSQADWSQTPV